MELQDVVEDTNLLDNRRKLKVCSQLFYVNTKEVIFLYNTF